MLGAYYSNVTKKKEVITSFPQNNFGINYYISNSGSSSNNGLSPAQAIPPSKITSLAFLQKTNLLFKCGEEFEINFSLTNGNVKFSYYGSGAKPIFYGSIAIDTLPWTDEGNGLWSTPMIQPNMIYISRVKAKLSETPWITITSYPQTNQFGINASSVSGYANIVGARVSVLLRSWTTEYVYTVNSYANAVVTLNQATATQTSIVGKTFKLLGKKDFPMVANGWAWEDGKLYIKSVASPAMLDIRMSSSNIAISIPDNVHDITIEQIDFRDYYYCAVKRKYSNNIVVSNCDISNTNGYGIVFLGTPNQMTVQGCVIFNCDGGIYDRATNYTYVNNNILYDIGMGYNYGNAVDSDLSASPNRAIFIRDNFTSSPQLLHFGGDISFNVVRNVASTGIQTQSKTKCSYNVIHDFMQRFTDGSAIYAVANNNSTATSYTEIFKNIISGAGASFSAGIYMDSGCVSFNIHDNVIFGITDAGINVNMDTQFTYCVNNIIVDCLECIRFRQDSSVDNHYAYNRGNVCTGNVLALRSLLQYCHQAEVFDSTVNYNPFGNNGGSDYNYYISPYMTRVGYNSDEVSMTFAQLQARYSTDANSTARVNYKTYVNQAQAEIDVKLFTNETNSPVTQAVGAGYIDINGNSVSSVVVPAYGGVVVLKS